MHGITVDFKGRWPGLLVHPIDDFVLGAPSRILKVLTMTKKEIWSEPSKKTYSKKYRVGKPLIDIRSATIVLVKASTFASVRGGSRLARTLAAAAYSGASLSQGPLEKIRRKILEILQK